MSSEKRKPESRFRNIMYSQQLSYINMSPKELYDKLLNELRPEMIALCVHDQDVDSNGKKAEPHVMVMMHFKDAKTISALSNKTGEAPQRFEIFDKHKGSKYDAENGFAYIIHVTPNSKLKHQYSATDVIANFDYVNYVIKYLVKLSKPSNKTVGEKGINVALDLLASGNMTLQECIDSMSGSQYARNEKQILAAHNLYLDREAKKFHKMMITEERQVESIWLYGESGTGKTHLAMAIANSKGPYFKTTTQQDPFQDYEGQHIILIDELRPGTMPYAQLLSLLDPYSYGIVSVGARYHNKSLSIGLILITSPYSPKEFVDGITNTRDQPQQLFRRINTLVKMEQGRILHVDPSSEIVLGQSKNKYSSSAMSKVKTNKIIKKSNLFEEIKEMNK